MFHIIWAILFIIKLYKSVVNAPNSTLFDRFQLAVNNFFMYSR